jgi:hypothetical protein
MKKIITVLLAVVLISSCTLAEKEKVAETTKEVVTQQVKKPKKTLDKRISLDLNLRQKNHQLSNMRSHLEAIQDITMLLANDEFDKASVLAYAELGSTTEMKLMCASFGNKQFENLGVDFHKSADEMSEIFKTKNKDESLKALSNTMNYCVQCHATFRQ